MKTNKTNFDRLAALIEEEERDQQAREDMADVEADRIIDHQAVQAWTDGRDFDKQDYPEKFGSLLASIAREAGGLTEDEAEQINQLRDKTPIDPMRFE